uniref:Uncharacterized protein n=1 Tax=Aegilops tauschii TaxID=37682 RepID=M8BUM6_AEGTA
MDPRQVNCWVCIYCRGGKEPCHAPIRAQQITIVETAMVEVTSWVEDVEKMLLEEHEPSSEVEQWREHSIYRVPARIKRLNGDAYKPQTVEEPAAKPADVRSARKLHEAGIRFRHSGRADCLCDVRFRGGTLTMPQLFVDDSTEYKLLNLMAFEALHVGAGNDVTAYVFFMRSIVGSVDDVRLLRSKGIVRSEWVDGDETVVRLLNDMTRDVVCDEASPLCALHGEVEAYCRSNLRVFLHVSWYYLKRTYFGNPWTFLSLAAGILLLITDIIQTVYSVLSYEVQGKTQYHNHK